MNFSEKLPSLILFGILLFFWNKYIVTTLVKKVVQLNPDNDWLAANQHIFIKGFQTFYWASYIMIIITFLVSE